MNKRSTTDWRDWPFAIKQYRTALGMTVLQFARKYEVSPQAIYMWESGSREAPYRITNDVVDWIIKGRQSA